MEEVIKIEKSSGNVFVDLGLDDPDKELLRAQLSLKVFKILEKKKLTQIQAGKLLEIDQSEISKLKNGDFERFSVERLMKFLTYLNQDIEIKVKASRRRNNPIGHIIVSHP